MNFFLRHSLITLLLTFGSSITFANDVTQRDTSKITEVQEIRNATLKITYADTMFLVDPMFAPKGYYDGFANTYRSYLRNPFVDLPMKAEIILQDVDAIIITHTHLDHWDDIAQKVTPKTLPIFVQNSEDKKTVEGQGFKDVRILTKTVFEGVTLTKIIGQHGTDKMYKNPELKKGLGETMGIVFEAKGHETIYLAGDTIWNTAVGQTIENFEPNLIVLNTGNALINGFKESIIMGKEDTAHAIKKAPYAKIIAVHMDAINHMSVTRKQLSDYVKEKGIDNKVLIPLDGQKISF
ncbi:MBL fold metallo-hydrolase [Acinetobacter sp. 161(2023)]|uniref:MBL fold metallo-hydrolase n=1 Tax=Acinetobacter sp. 161(2023) TaxID=3098768 RepID=UPI0030093DF4